MSSDGRYVAFSSAATNLLSGSDPNGVTDIFLRDRTAGTTIRVSVAWNGAQANALSLHPSMSSDGRYITFASEATNLVKSDTNGANDVFLRDRVGLTSQRLSLTSTGGQANGASDNPAISGNGNYIAFESLATNLFVGDNNGAADVFVRPRQGGTTELMSIDITGGVGAHESYDTAISADGCYVAFESWATDLVSGVSFVNKQVFVRKRCAPTVTELVSLADLSPDTVGNLNSGDPSITVVNNCYLVAFESWSGNLDPRQNAPETISIPNRDQDGDVFVRDGCTLTTERISRIDVPAFDDPDPLRPGYGYNRRDSIDPVISANGQLVAFKSRVWDFVTDTNGEADIFAWQR